MAAPEIQVRGPASGSEGEEARLAALARSRALDTPREAFFDDVAHLAAQACQSPIALVNLIGRDRQWLKARVGLDLDALPRGWGWCERVMRARGPVLVPDALADPEHARDPLVAAPPRVRSYAGVPLVSGEGFALGTLCVMDTRARAFDSAHVRSLEALARQVVARLESRRAAPPADASGRNFHEFVDGVEGILREADASTLAFTFVNRRAEDILGYRAEEWLASPSFWADHIHPADREWAVGFCVAQTTEGNDHELEYRMIAKDGRVVWVRDVVWLVRDEAGKARALRGLMTDVTRRKEAERRLLLQQAATAILSVSKTPEEAIPALLQSIAETMGWDVANAWRVEEDGLRAEAHWTSPGLDAGAFRDATRRHRCRAGEDLPGRVLAEGRAAWVHDVAAEESFPRRAEAAQAGLRSAAAFPVRTRAGVAGVIEVYTRDLLRADGEMLAVLEAVGAQVGLFMERRAAVAALRDSDARKGAILAAALDAIVTVDERGRVVEWNRAAEAAFGHARDDAMGQSLVDLIVAPQHRGAHRDAFERHLATGESPLLGRRVELPALRKDGTPLAAEVALVRVPTPGAPLFTAFLRDVTERRRADAELRFQKALLEAQMESSVEAIVVLDVEDRVIASNRGFLATWDLAPRDLERAGLLDALATRAEDPGAFLAGVRDLHASPGRVVRDEVHVKDGRVLERHGSLVRGADGTEYGRRWAFRDVTARRRVEDQLARALREVEEQRGRLGAIVTSVPGVVWEAWGRPGDAAPAREGFVSEHVERMLGYAPHEWLAQPGFWLAIIHPDDRETVARTAREQYEGGRGGTLQFRWRRKDGTYLWCQTWSSVITDAAGRPAGMRGVTMDITPLKEAEAALRATEERFRRAFEDASVGMLLTTPEGRLVEANAAFARMLGRSPQDVVGLHFDALTHPDDQDESREAVHAMLSSSQRSVAFEKRYLHKNGSPVWARVSSSLVRSLDGRPEYFITQVQDVTARRQAEVALRESEARYRLLAENAKDLITRSDAEGRFSYVSPAIRDILGHEPEDLLGRSASELIHPDDLADALHGLARPARDARAQTLTFRCRRIDGSYTWMEVVARPVLDGATGRLREVVAGWRDVSDRKRTEEALRHSGEKMRAILESISDAFFALDDEWRFTYVNREAEALLGRSAQELLGRGIWAEYPDAVGTRFEREYRRAVETQSPVHFEEYNDAHQVWYEVKAYPSSDGLSVYFRDVTARKNAEAELERVKHNLELILNSAGEGIYGVDEDGVTTFMNAAALKILGLTEREAVGRKLHDVIHHTHADGRAYPVEECPIYKAARGEGGGPCTGDVFWRLDGTSFPVEYVTTPLMDQGRVIGAVTVFTDVTQRRRAEAAIRESEARYRFLAENARDMITRSSPDGRLLYVSPAARQLLGYDPEDLVGRVSMEFVHPDDLERVRRERAQISAGEQARTVTLRFRRKDGQYVWLEAIAQAVHDPKTGQLLEFVGASRDITERKRTEEELARRAEELHRIAEELRYQSMLTRAITDNTASALFMMDRRGHPIFMNPAAVEMTGYASVDEIKDRPLHDAIHFKKPDGSPYPMDECPIDRANAGIVPLKGQRETFVRKDGTLFPVEYNVAPVMRGGEAHGAVIEVRDITAPLEAERKLRERAEQLARLAEALQRSNRELDQFAYITSHDLKAPLRGISNLSRWIEEDLGERLTDESQSHLELLRGRVMRMEALIDAILEYSRAGRLKGKPEAVDVGALLRDVIDLASPPPEFRIDVQPGMPTVVGDRTRLQQVFLNLIANAVKHHHRKDGRIVVGAEDAGEHYRFFVTDDGPGIDPRYHDRIFLIFQTLQPRDKVEGAGVGLALVRKIVESHGGSITVESAEGEGATFRFTWPKATKGD